MRLSKATAQLVAASVASCWVGVIAPEQGQGAGGEMTTANRGRPGNGAPHNLGFADVFGGWLWGGEAAFAGDEVEHRAHIREVAEAIAIADKDAPCGQIVKVMDAAQDANIKFVSAYTKDVSK